MTPAAKLAEVVTNARAKVAAGNGDYLDGAVVALADTVDLQRRAVRKLVEGDAVFACTHCGSALGEAPLPTDHWRTCEKHPARAERDAMAAENGRLQSDVEFLRREAEHFKALWSAEVTAREQAVRNAEAATAENARLREELAEAKRILALPQLLCEAEEQETCGWLGGPRWPDAVCWEHQRKAFLGPVTGRRQAYVDLNRLESVEAQNARLVALLEGHNCDGYYTGEAFLDERDALLAEIKAGA